MANASQTVTTGNKKTVPVSLSTLLAERLAQPEYAIPRNWTVKLATDDAYYMHDDEETSRALFTGWKDKAQSMTLAEAEDMAAGLTRQGWNVILASAGGEG